MKLVLTKDTQTLVQLSPGLPQVTMGGLPELHRGDVAHSPQQGSFTQSAGDVALQLGLRLGGQAGVQQGQAISNSNSVTMEITKQEAAGEKTDS